jgi:cell division transport system permease protein
MANYSQRKKTMPNIDKKLKTPGAIQFLLSHLRALLNSLGQFSHAPAASFVTFFVIGIALALPVGLIVALQNTHIVSQGIRDSGQITLYLRKEISPAQRQTLSRHLRADRRIAKTHYISPQQGLKGFVQNTGFSPVIKDLKTNPLPGVIVISPSKQLTQAWQLQQLLDQLKHLPNVASAQLDLKWLKRLNAILGVGHRISWLLSLLFGLAVMFVIGNTIRLTTQAHYQEIAVIKMLGGTDRFVRRPFLYSGLIYGLAGAILAWFIIDIAVWCLSPAIAHLANLYGSNYRIIGMSARQTGWLLFSGMALGWIGSWFALNKYIRSIEAS